MMQQGTLGESSRPRGVLNHDRIMGRNITLWRVRIVICPKKLRPLIQSDDLSQVRAFVSDIFDRVEQPIAAIFRHDKNT